MLVLQRMSEGSPNNASPEERIEAVWMLTELCLAWNKPSASEPRLQRTVTRLQRAQR